MPQVLLQVLEQAVADHATPPGVLATAPFVLVLQTSPLPPGDRQVRGQGDGDFACGMRATGRLMRRGLAGPAVVQSQERTHKIAAPTSNLGPSCSNVLTSAAGWASFASHTPGCSPGFSFFQPMKRFPFFSFPAPDPAARWLALALGSALLALLSAGVALAG